MINKGCSEEEAEALDQQRIEKLKASRARKMAIRLERRSLTGSEDVVIAATAMANTHKELTKEFKLPSQKGVRKQTTIQAAVTKRQQSEEKFKQRQVNPRVKGLENVPGVTVAEDGTIGLAELREQRPDIFAMKPMGIEGKEYGLRRKQIARLRRAEGREDKYGHLIDD